MEVIRDGEANAATALVRRSKDAPTGERIRFNMRFQKVARLAGAEFDGSLVPEFVKEEPIVGVPTPADGRTISWLEDLLMHMAEEEVISLKQAVLMTGRHDNKHYKTKLAEMLPFDVAVEVRDAHGDVIGQIGRMQGSRPDNQFGDIKCLSKMAA